MAMTNRGPINIVAAGTALSAVLVTLYVGCALAELIFPNLPLAHGWLAIFSTGPTNTAGAWLAPVVSASIAPSASSLQRCASMVAASRAQRSGSRRA